MRRLSIRLAPFFVVVAMVGAACSSKSPTASGGSPSASASEASPSASASESSGGTMTIGSDTANNHGSEDVSGKTSEEVEMDDFYFGPTVLTGKPGQTLKIELKNESKSGTLHNFSLDAQSISQDVPSGTTTDVTVTFPASGFVEFYCKYHRSSGM